MDCHATANVDDTLPHLLHLGVLHDVIFAFVVWISDAVYKLTLLHAKLVPTEPIPAREENLKL